MFAGAHPFIFANAKALRATTTPAETKLWEEYLKTKPFGYKFRRQHPYGPFIADFYCHRLKLIIELDGSIHRVPEVKENDHVRQEMLESDGIKVIRFTNEEVHKDLPAVISTIEHYILTNQQTNTGTAQE